MKPTIIYLVRHGQSQGNAMHEAGTPIRPKDEFESSLTQKGREQVSETVAKLSHIPFAHIYSSNLRRAVESAQIAREHFSIPHSIHPHIYERKIKSLENKSPEDIQKEFGERFKYWGTLGEEESLRFKLQPTDESMAETRLQFTGAVTEIIKAHEGEVLLIISHGALMRNFLVEIGFAPWEQLETMAIENAGFVKLEHKDDKFTVTEAYKVDKR